MSKAIERRMTLKDQVTPTMSKINKTTLSYKKSVRDLQYQGKKTWRSLKSGMLGVAAAGATLMGSVMAIQQTTEAYQNQIEAETKLEAVMKSTGKATQTQVGELKKYASSLQQIGVVGDEVTLSGMQQLATFNVTSDTIKELSPGMADLVAQQKGVNATQTDMISIANMVGKAMGGQVGALSKVGISFTEAQANILKYGTEEEKAATLAQVLQQNVGGVNEALASTDIGQIAQAKNAIGDFQESIGGAVVNIKAGLASAFLDNLPAIQTAIDKVTASINGWVDSGGVERVINVMINLKDTAIMLAPVIGIAAVGLIGYKIYAMQAAASQWSLNAAMAANPIGFVITAVIALIGVVAFLRAHFQRIKLVSMQVWNAVMDGAQGAVSALTGVVNKMISIFSYGSSMIKYFFAMAWDAVVTKAEEGIKKLAEPINAVLSALGKETIQVDFSSLKKNVEKPTYTETAYVDWDLSNYKFSDDAIMSQVDKAKTEKAKYETDKVAEETANLTAAIDSNTGAVTENTAAVKSSSKDMTGEEIADRLLPRLERAIYG